MRTIAPLFCALSLSSAAFAADDRVMVYTMHETPSDPTSAVECIVKLDLRVYSVIENKGDDGGTVYWDVYKIDIIEVVNGANNRTWQEIDPTVDTPTGRWATTHDDLNNILTREFDAPPLVSGLAPPNGHTGDDLDYDFEAGVAGTSDPYPTTAYLDWYFIEENATTPLTTGDDEPVSADDE